MHGEGEQSIEEHGADLTVRRSGTAELFGGTIPDSVGAPIALIPAVVAVSSEVISLVGTDRDEHVPAAGWAQDSFFWQKVPLEEGGCQIGTNAKSHWSASTSPAPCKSTQVRPSASWESSVTRFNSIINRNVVVIPLADMQELTFRPRRGDILVHQACPSPRSRRGRARCAGH
jgi:hypothetical protein